jgi:hypothetical protein
MNKPQDITNGTQVDVSKTTPDAPKLGATLLTGGPTAVTASAPGCTETLVTPENDK